MPASRVIVHSPTKQGAIGFSTPLPPSMTLGCGSWGGNVTSDNVSPLHLMDIKRVAFETRPVKSARPVASTQTVAASTKESVVAGGKIDRQEIAAIVDRFLAGKRIEPAASPLPSPAPPESEAGSMYVAPAPKETRANGGSERPPEPVSKPAAAPPSNNGA